MSCGAVIITTAQLHSAKRELYQVVHLRWYQVHHKNTQRLVADFLPNSVHKNFAIFAGKLLYWRHFFNIVAEAYSFAKNETSTQVFSCKYCEILQNTFRIRGSLIGLRKCMIKVLCYLQSEKI